MFTVRMLDRLSEWSANMSLLFFGALVLPSLFGQAGNSVFNDVLLGVGGMVVGLWISLRISRKADEKGKK